MWRQIKSLVLNRKQTVIQNVMFNKVEVRDNKEIRDQFYNYFVSSIAFRRV